MTANDEIRDLAIAHQVYLLRYQARIVREITDLLKQVEADLLLQLNSATTEWQADRLEQQLQGVRTIISESYQAADNQLRADLKELAVYEAEHQDRVINEATPIELATVMPSAEAIIAAVESRPFEGKILSEWAQKLEEDAYTRIRDAVRMGVIEGESYHQITKRVMGTKALQYSDGVLALNFRQAQALVATAVAHTANEARQTFYGANDDLIKGVQWVSTLDARTTPVCQSRDGKVYPVDSGPRPPAHFRCVLPSTRISPIGGISYIAKRPHNGEVITFRCTGNKSFTVTPNHPIMTDRGFVAAKFVQKSDNLVSGLLGNAFISGRNNDEVIPRIEDRFNSLSGSLQMLACPVPLTPEDFHNDILKEEVGVILVDLKLAHEFVTNIAHQFVKSFLKVRTSGTLLHEPSLGLFDKFVMSHFRSSHCGVSFSGQSLDLFMGCIIHSGLLLLRAIATKDAMLFQEQTDATGSYTEILSNSTNSSPCVEHLHDFNRIERFMNMDIASINSIGFCESIEDRFADAELCADFIRLEPRAVHFDSVIEKEITSFSGHVYNLGCDEGVYSANGIILHNCRSSTAPVLKSWKEMGLPERDIPPGTRASMDGQVAEAETYQTWLKKKSPAFQDDVLGPTRGKLFREGMTLDRFVDQSGKEYTLKQLRSKDATVFKKAGI